MYDLDIYGIQLNPEFEHDLEVMNEYEEFPMQPSLEFELDPEETADMERSVAQGEWMDSYLDAIDDYDHT